VANAPYQSVDPFGLSALPSFTMLTQDAQENANENAALRGGLALQAALLATNRILDALVEFGLDGPDRVFPGIDSDGGSTSNGSRRSGCHPVDAKKAPKLLSVNDRTHGGPLHDGAIVRRVAFLVEMNKKYNSAIRYNRLRKHQQQVNAIDQKVSTCLPDLQYNFYALHYLEEYFYLSDMTQTINKMLVMNRADPFSAQLAYHLGKRK